MKLYLASTSKHKSEILDKVFLKHNCISSDFEEVGNKENVYEYVKSLSLGKAKSIVDKVNDGIIIGLDTVNLVDGKVIEKPKSIEEAKENVRRSGKFVIRVITGVTIINTLTNETVSTYQETKLKMRPVSESDIEFYIKNEPAHMYVSGFVVETILSNYLEYIDGSFYNILGVPVETIYKILNDMGYTLKDLERSDDSCQKTYS